MADAREPERWPALEAVRQFEALMLQRIQKETRGQVAFRSVDITSFSHSCSALPRGTRTCTWAFHHLAHV
jgi:hypothetical protein